MYGEIIIEHVINALIVSISVMGLVLLNAFQEKVDKLSRTGRVGMYLMIFGGILSTLIFYVSVDLLLVAMWFRALFMLGIFLTLFGHIPAYFGERYKWWRHL
ncbi:hypothetical protein N9Y67_00140 [Pseudomonadota bacterium]|nr:hypothetical protein [Pseudomonadota bacterium]